MTVVTAEVSIPFREDLYSDNELSLGIVGKIGPSFHPFQGRPLFGQMDEATARLILKL